MGLATTSELRFSTGEQGAEQRGGGRPNGDVGPIPYSTPGSLCDLEQTRPCLLRDAEESLDEITKAVKLMHRRSSA